MLFRSARDPPSRVFVDFNHEPDDAKDLGGSNTDRTAAGSSAGFKAAFAYLVHRFKSEGVTQVVWAVVFSGFQSSASRKPKRPCAIKARPERGAGST